MPDPLLVQGATVGAVLGLHHLVLGWLYAAGRIPRNPLVGIRIRTVLRSDDAWTRGHAAAGRLLVRLSPFPIVAVIAAVVWPAPWATAAALFAEAAGLAALFAGVVAADRAARI